MTTKIQLRRDTGTNWDANSTVVLSAGEIGVNLTNGQFKLGDGTSTWAQLSYYGGVTATGSFTNTSISDITTTAPTVVWSASQDYISGVKLQIQVEASEVGDSSGWHSQMCEAIIASRGYASVYGGPGGDPQMTVYAVTHTSTVPLVTFTVQRNPTTKKIEVVGTLTAAATSANLRIYSVETATRD